MAGFVLEFERHIVELEETIERLRALPTTGGISVDDQIAELRLEHAMNFRPVQTESA